MTNFKLLLPFIVALTLLTIFSINIPFFWDSAFFSSLSLHFYENGFNGFIAPEALDTGGFPFYSAYLTIGWKLFGKTLTISHFAMLPFLIGLFYQFFKLCKRYLNEKTIVWALILFIIEPVFLTQSILMGYDILIAFFFLIALNALYENKKFLFSIAILLLCLVSIRGMMLALALFIIDVIQHKKFDFVLFKNYIPTIIILSIWTIYHKQQTGWYIFSPFREDNAEDFSGISMLFRQFIYIIWKNLDLGRIALWIIVLFFGRFLFKNKIDSQHKELLRSIFIPLLVLSLFMILINNPIGHKYFLVVFLLLTITTCYFLQHLKNQKSKMLVLAFVSISLVAGNFINYPQRYGNTWDSSLKIIPYFEMDKQMNAYISKKNISSNSIGTQFPLTTNLINSYLSNSPFQYTDIEKEDINTYPYFLYSNIINSGRMDDIETIQKNWTVETEMQSGMIQLILYKNPNF